MIQFKSLQEGVTYDASTDSFQFNFAHDEKTDVMHLTFKPKTLVGKHEHAGVTYFCGYELNSLADKEVRHQFLHALKEGKIDQQNLEHLVNKAIIGLNRTFPIENLSIVIAPKSSAPLAAMIANKIASVNTNVLVTSSAIVKNSIENISIDYDSYTAHAKTPEEKARLHKQLEHSFAQATKTGMFKIKNVYGPLRKFVHNYLVFDSETSRQVFNRIHGGNVLLVDDYETTGQTMHEMMNLVSGYAPNNVTIFTLIKN